MKNINYSFIILSATSLFFYGCSLSKNEQNTSDIEEKIEIIYPDKEIFDIAGEAKKMITGGAMWYDAGLYEFSPQGEWKNAPGKLERDSINRIVTYSSGKKLVNFKYNDDSSLKSYSVGNSTHTVKRNARGMEKGFDYIAIDDEGNWIGRIDLKRGDTNKNRDQIRYISYYGEEEFADLDTRKRILEQFKNFSEDNSSPKYYTSATTNTYSSVYPYRSNPKNRVTLLDIYATGSDRAKGLSLVEDDEFGINYFAATSLKKDAQENWKISYMEIINMINFEKTPVQEQ